MIIPLIIIVVLLFIGFIVWMVTPQTFHSSGWGLYKENEEYDDYYSYGDRIAFWDTIEYVKGTKDYCVETKYDIMQGEIHLVVFDVTDTDMTKYEELVPEEMCKVASRDYGEGAGTDILELPNLQEGRQYIYTVFIDEDSLFHAKYRLTWKGKRWQKNKYENNY